MINIEIDAWCVFTGLLTLKVVNVTIQEALHFTSQLAALLINRLGM